MNEFEGLVAERHVLVDGIRMHYRQAGSGPALVLLHGLVGSAMNWDRNIESFAKEATVYALDLPNMGDSERCATLDAGLTSTVDRIAKWMDAVGLAEADIAAHSYGGALALMMASRHSAKVRRLVLFAPANPFCNAGRHLIRFYSSDAGRWVAKRIPSFPRSVYKLALARMYGDARRVRSGALEGYTINLNTISIGHVMGIVRQWGTDMRALLKSLQRMKKKPVLLIWGDRDRAVSLESSAALRAYLPQSSLLVISGVGHLAFEETPEICNKAVREWLRTGDVTVDAQRWSPVAVSFWDHAVQA